MKFFSIKIKVRYCETDQMGLVHHGSYINYFEEARISWISNLGFSYSEMEKSGIILPVSKLNVSYLRPAYFDDELVVNVELAEPPTSRLIFNYTIKNKDKVVVTGTTVLAFLNKETKKPVRCPDYMLEKVTPLFK
jgi:acyl-CoA thioester hydrolase